MKFCIGFLLLMVETFTIIKANPLGIIYGTLIFPHSMPHLAFLEISGSDDVVRCGGSLISLNYVLTAARCLKNANSVKVTLGADDLTKPEKNQIILDTAQANFIMHKDYDKDTFENDIALIKLPQEIVLNEIIQTIGVAKQGDVANLTDKMVIATGWGVTYYGSPNSLSTVPLAMWLNVIPNTNSECDSVFGDKIKDTNICCSAHSSWLYPLNICDGDWGAPLTRDGENLLVGIASFTVDYGYSNCGRGKPNVFTDVTKYTKWIQQNSDLE